MNRFSLIDEVSIYLLDRNKYFEDPLRAPPIYSYELQLSFLLHGILFRGLFHCLFGATIVKTHLYYY